MGCGETVHTSSNLEEINSLSSLHVQRCYLFILLSIFYRMFWRCESCTENKSFDLCLLLRLWGDTIFFYCPCPWKWEDHLTSHLHPIISPRCPIITWHKMWLSNESVAGLAFPGWCCPDFNFCITLLSSIIAFRSVSCKQFLQFCVLSSSCLQLLFALFKLSAILVCSLQVVCNFCLLLSSFLQFWCAHFKLSATFVSFLQAFW